MLSICFMFFLLLVCGFDCLFLDAIAIAWFFGCRFVLLFLCQLLVGFVAKGRKRLKKRLSVDPNCRTSMSSYFLKSIPAETCACLNNLAVNLSDLRKRFETV